MKVPISPRLLVCAGFVAPGERVADVGCDHGYLSIYLLVNGIARSCIASDVKEQPLLSAVRNAEKFGVRGKMEFCLCDGAVGIPRDFDCIVCAGMGSDTIVSILEAAPWLRDRRYRLILQCQSKTPMLRQYLSDMGWRITEESALRDGRFLYTVMEVYYEPDYPRLTAAEAYFPPALLENPSTHTAEYYRWVLEGLRIAATHRHDPEQLKLLDALTALAEVPELRWLKEEAT